MEKLSGTQSKQQQQQQNHKKRATQSAMKDKITLIIKKTKVEEDLKQNPLKELKSNEPL